MQINYVSIKNAITPNDSATTSAFFQEIETASGFSLQEVSLKQWLDNDFALIYIATGGTENLFLENYELLTSKTCYLLTSGQANSLAAAMEILTYLKANHHKGEILHGSANEIGKRIVNLKKAYDAYVDLQYYRVGMLGKPSDWLIASVYDEKALAAKLHLEVVNISIEEVIAEIKKDAYIPNQYTKELQAKSYNPEELTKALNVYGAFKRIVDKYHLDGITVRCFDLLDTVYTTGCLGLAILNATGIDAGCEGDLPALLSMAILRRIAKQPAFMCNPSKIDLKNNEMILAHCTMPLNMCYQYDLTTHYESGIGVAVAGSIMIGNFTIFKTDGSLERYYVDSGKILENLRLKNLCRSQIKVRLSDYQYFLTDPIANHHVICLGNQTLALTEFFKLIAE